MIPLSTAARIAFTPAHRAGDPDAPVYWLRAGSVTDRDALEVELASPPYNADRIWPFERWAELETGVATVFAEAAPEDRARLAEALALGRAGQADAAALALIAQLEDELAQRWPPFARLVRQEKARRIHLPTVAAHSFLVGWENVGDADGTPLAFATGIDGRVRAELLLKLPAADLTLLGWHAYGLLYADAARPFLPPPSKSGATRKPMNSGAPIRSAAKAGTSAARSGPKTRR